MPKVRHNPERPRLILSTEHQQGYHDNFVNTCTLCKEAREKEYARRKKIGTHNEADN